MRSLGIKMTRNKENLETRPFVCPLDVGFLMSDPEYLNLGLRHFGIEIEFSNKKPPVRPRQATKPEKYVQRGKENEED